MAPGSSRTAGPDPVKNLRFTQSILGRSPMSSRSARNARWRRVLLRGLALKRVQRPKRPLTPWSAAGGIPVSSPQPWSSPSSARRRGRADSGGERAHPRRGAHAGRRHHPTVGSGVQAGPVVAYLAAARQTPSFAVGARLGSAAYLVVVGGRANARPTPSPSLVAVLLPALPLVLGRACSDGVVLHRGCRPVTSDSSQFAV